MSKEPVTPSTQGRKRELTSPEFDIDLKKNKTLPISPASDSEPTSVLDSGSAMAALDPSSHIIIPESEMEKLSALLTDTFQGQILTLVNGIVDGVLKGIQDNLSEVKNGEPDRLDDSLQRSNIDFHG